MSCVFLLTVLATPRASLRQGAEAYAVATASSPLHCPCDDPRLCAPITGPPVAAKEIFGFVGGNGASVDFTRVTSIAWISDPAVVCAAHAAGTRVIIAAPRPEQAFSANHTVRRLWVREAVAAVQHSFADGITFDWELPCAAGCANATYYSLLIAETRAALQQLSPSYQVSVCVAWSPDGIDGRNYDVVSFARAADLLYVMDYDTRSQIVDACIAGANAPLPGTVRGISRYLALGIPPSQLILGVPWYGYRYPCLPGTASDARFCPIASRPFRGVNCSDAAGTEVPVSSMLQRLANSTTGLQWDESQGAPYFNTVEAGGSRCNTGLTTSPRSHRSMHTHEHSGCAVWGRSPS